MKKYSAMAMYDGVIPEHRDVYLVEEVEAEIDELVDMLEKLNAEIDEQWDLLCALETITRPPSNVGWAEINALIKKHKGE